MKIIVNDTNILIDLISIDLLDDFLSLDFEFHTNDLIINEISEPEQKRIITEIIESKNIIVNETKAEDYTKITSLMTKNLTFEDCSIWYYTKQLNGILLTGDARLRKTVEQDNIEVRGILYVFDVLIENDIISKDTAINKLNELLQINTRLPKIEINRRLTLWEVE